MGALFPAHAGVIPSKGGAELSEEAIPRTRGGDPDGVMVIDYANELFPAHAGVIPKNRRSGTVSKTIPRTRGGDPS